METCVFETFRRHLPHLCDKTREAAPDIYDFEDLLEAAATEGLRRMEFGWLAWRETFVIVEEAASPAWINFLSKAGFRSIGASYSSTRGAVTAGLMHPDGRRIALVMQGEEAGGYKK